MTASIKRRQFITLLGGAAAAWPIAGRAQQPTPPVIGFLNSGSAWEGAPMADAFRRGLAELGYVEGRNVLIDYRWAEGHYERLPALAAELVRRSATVIAALGTPAAPAAKAATASIPIVFRIAVDPVELGLVESFSRPGGNLTGVVSLNVELEPKKLEVLHELLPEMKVVALLINPTSLNADAITKTMQSAADALGLQLHVQHAGTESDFDAAFVSIVQRNAKGIVVGSDPFFANHAARIAALALRHSLPAISTRDFASAGGIMGYGGGNAESYRMSGVYTGRILKGEKPADLPVQQLTKIELAINMKTAKALGLTVPISLLGRADEVIE